MSSQDGNYRKVCLVLLIGIPASGKTEMCKFLKAELGIYQIKHIHYDDLLGPVSKDGEWREARDSIVHSVVKHAEEFKQIHENDGDQLIILIDDNNYYQSMRRKYYKVAKKCNYGFCQIYMYCDRGTAIQRIIARKSESMAPIVTPEIVDRILLKLEPPNHSNPWEISSVTISTERQSGCSNKLHYQINELPGEKAVLAAIEKIIKDELYVKHQNITPILPEVTSCRYLHSNFLEDLDVALRKQISTEVIAAQESGRNSLDLQIFVQNLNLKRRMLLKKFSCGTITDKSVKSIVDDFTKSLHLDK